MRLEVIALNTLALAAIVLVTSPVSAVEVSSLRPGTAVVLNAPREIMVTDCRGYAGWSYVGCLSGTYDLLPRASLPIGTLVEVTKIRRTFGLAFGGGYVVGYKVYFAIPNCSRDCSFVEPVIRFVRPVDLWRGRAYDHIFEIKEMDLVENNS